MNYRRFLNRTWDLFWKSKLLIKLRHRTDSDQHRGWFTWSTWIAFWLIAPLACMCFGFVFLIFLGLHTAIVCAITILIWLLHLTALWDRPASAVRELLRDQIQVSWISKAIVSAVFISISLLGFSVVSIISSSIGFGYTLFDFQKVETGSTDEAAPEVFNCECEIEAADTGNQTSASATEPEIGRPRFASVALSEGLPLWWPTNVSENLLAGIDGRLSDPSDLELNEELCSARNILVFGSASSDGMPGTNLRLARDRANTLEQFVSRRISDCQSDTVPEILKISLGFSIAATHDAWQRRAIILTSDMRPGDFTPEQLKSEVEEFFNANATTSLKFYSAFEVCQPENSATCRWEPVP